jgi:hypothetical protein
MIIFGHRPTQTDTDISVPRVAGLKESSRSCVKNSLIWSFPKGSTFCFAIVGKAKSLCASRERSERVANNKNCFITSREVFSILVVHPKPAPWTRIFTQKESYN